MNPKKNIFQKSLITLVALFATGYLQSDQLEDLGGTGCLPLTEQELAFLELSIDKVVEIAPNQLGLERIQEYLKEQNLSPDSISPQKFGLGYSIRRSTTSDALAEIPLQATLPRSVNNSLLPSFPPIGHQGSVGSCVGFASTYYQASHEIALVNGLDNKNSFNGVLSPKWTYNLLNDGVDQGISPQEAFKLLSFSGAPSIINVPYTTNYTEWTDNSNNWISALSNRTTPWSFIPGLGGFQQQNLTAIKQALVNGHVVSFTTYISSWRYTKIKADPDFPNNPYIGQWAAHSMTGTLGSHHMTIVGYDDDLWIDVNDNGVVDTGERGAFLIANSWGTSWANRGFIWVSYDAFLGVSAVSGGPSVGRVPMAISSNSGVYFLTAKAPFYTPSLVGQFSLTQAARDQFAIQVGASPLSQTTPTTAPYLPGLTFQGGSRAFDGTLPATAQTMTFAADLSDFLTMGLLTPLQNYYLIVRDSATGNPTTLNSFSLLDRINNKTINTNQVPVNIDNATQTIQLKYSFSQDTTPPTISFLTPTNGAILKGVIQVAVTANDNIDIASVDLNLDSSLYAKLTNRPYTVSLDTTKLTNGTHKIEAIATDLSGNKSSITIAVQAQNDSIPPKVTMIAPINGATVSGRVTLQAIASDNIAVANVKFYVDAVQMATDTTSPYSAIFDTGLFLNGLHQVRAVVTDTANNQSTASILIQIQNTVAAGIYVNAGGPATVFGGVTWMPDTPYLTGSTATFFRDISALNPVYDTERSGNMTYQFNVTNGTHQVVLKFAETFYTAAKQRVFNVIVNGKTVRSKLDIFKLVGFGIPFDFSIPVTVKDNKIKIQFSAITGSPKINAIQITPL